MYCYASMSEKIHLNQTYTSKNAYKIEGRSVWESQGQELWFQKMMDTGVFSGLRYGDFLPSVPMFCPSEDVSCDEGLFEPTEIEVALQAAHIVDQ
jgi:hypothetical protein